MFCTCSKEVEPPTKVVQKVGAEEQEPAAAALDSKYRGPRASPAGAVDHLVKAMLCIGVHGNNGPKAVLIHLPVDKSSEGSETELAGGDAGNVSHIVVGQSNMATMSTLNVNIMKSSGPEKGPGTACLHMVACPQAQTFP